MKGIIFNCILTICITIFLYTLIFRISSCAEKVAIESRQESKNALELYRIGTQKNK